MKPPPPKDSNRQAAPVGDTQVIDLKDVELLVAQAEQSQRSLPPPLPPEIRASHVPSEPPPGSQPPQASQPPLSHAPSFYPSQAPAAPRSTAFYAVALLVFLVVGIGGGVLVAVTLRKAPSVAPTPSARPQAAVITIPTVEVDDDPDGGK